MRTIGHVMGHSLFMSALACAGCSAGTGAPGATEPESIGASKSDLASEMWNGSASIVYAGNRYTTNPDMAVNQWAEASLNGTSCNGVMIGPNTYFTAAHCGGGADAQILFRTYRNLSTSTSDTEAFTCNELIQTFSDTDGAVFYCAANAAGENPGDKYGYVDFDVSDPTVGQQVYSISANAIVNGSVPHDARMYVTGEVIATNDNGWYVPDSNPNTGIVMSLWGEPGMSGSPHFNAANNKMIIAPLSLAPDGGWGRWANSMHSLLYWGYVNPNYNPAQQGPTVNTAFVQSLGLTPSTYYGWADKNLDWEFDVQYDLERLRHEARRGWYALGFESQRRNALWDPTAGVTTLDTTNRWASVVKTGAGYADVLTHNELNLTAGSYRVSFMAYTSAAAYSDSLLASFKSGGSYFGGRFVPTTVGGGWQMHAIDVTVPSDGASLVFGVEGAAQILISAVNVVKHGEVMDFDTFDKRMDWRNDIDGSRALVVPDGRTTGSPNWAVYVSAHPTSAYPVRNRELALVGGRPYRVCYDARLDSPVGYAQAELRVVSSGAVAATSQPYLSTIWSTYCTTFTPATDDNNLQIRLMSGTSPFLVDNIAITEL